MAIWDSKKPQQPPPDPQLAEDEYVIGLPAEHRATYEDRRDYFIRELGFELGEAHELARTANSKWYVRHVVKDLECSRALALRILL